MNYLTFLTMDYGYGYGSSSIGGDALSGLTAFLGTFLTGFAIVIIVGIININPPIVGVPSLLLCVFSK